MTKKSFYQSDKHVFSFYVENLSSLIASTKIGGSLVLRDKKMYHRIIQVLRLRPGNSCIFFDEAIHVYFLIQKVIGNQIYGTIEKKQINKIIQPHITSILPLLKRDSLETALYALVEMGINTIQLMITSKVQRKWGGEKEKKRLQRIIIAAKEQSKNFTKVLLQSPQSFGQIIESSMQATINIHFDFMGESLSETLNKIKQRPTTPVVLMIGPEGDFTDQEKRQLKQTSFLPCKLTPTILRSSQAITLGSGIIRSLL